VWWTWPTAALRLVIICRCISSNMHRRFNPLFGLIATFVSSHDAVSPAVNWTWTAEESGVIISENLNRRSIEWQLKGMSVCPIYAYKHDPALYEMKILLLSTGKRMVNEIHSVADVAVYLSLFFFFFGISSAQILCIGCSKVHICAYVQ